MKVGDGGRWREMHLVVLGVDVPIGEGSPEGGKVGMVRLELAAEWSRVVGLPAGDGHVRRCEKV